MWVDEDDIVVFLPPLLAAPVYTEQHYGDEEETPGSTSYAYDAAF